MAPIYPVICPFSALVPHRAAGGYNEFRLIAVSSRMMMFGYSVQCGWLV